LLNKKSLDAYLEIWPIRTNWKALKLGICSQNQENPSKELTSFWVPLNAQRRESNYDTSQIHFWIRLNFQLHPTEPTSKLSLYYHPPSIGYSLSGLQSITKEKNEGGISEIRK
jgi:hypothetical protein